MPSLAKWLLLGLLVLPVAEIAVFIAVASRMGVLATLALATALFGLGVAAMRRPGSSTDDLNL